MAGFVQLTGLDGAYSIAVSASSIYRVTPALALAHEPPNTVRVDFGAEKLFVTEELLALVSRLTAAGCALVRFTNAAGGAVFLNRNSISKIQLAEAVWDPPGANTTLFVNGKRQAVIESYGDVKVLLGLT